MLSKNNLILFLSTSIPFLSYVGTNLQQLYYYDFVDLFKYFILFFIFIFLSCKFLSKVNFLKNKNLEITIAYFVLIFFNYNSLQLIFRDILNLSEFRYVSFISWLLLLALVICKFTFLSIKKNIINFSYKFFSIFFLISFIFLFINFLTLKKYEDFNYENYNQFIEENIKLGSTKLNNVYYILLDSYPRQDILEKDFNFDNSEFLKNMNNIGFENLSNSMTNVPSTHLNQTLVFDMNLKRVNNYIKNIKETDIGVPKEFSDWKYGHTIVHKIFHELGYLNFVSFDTTFRGTPCRIKDLSSTGFDKCISQKAILRELEINFLKNTPFIDILGKFFPSFFSYLFLYPKDITKNLESIIPKDKSIFYYSHIMIPHPPPKYDDYCKIRTEIFEMNITSNVSDEAKKGVIQDIRCLNSEVLELSKKIISLDPNAIIIFQSDNGWPFNKYPMDHFNINIWKVPKECKKMLKDDFTNVNTFRVVFNCLEVSNFNLRPNQLINY